MLKKGFWHLLLVAALFSYTHASAQSKGTGYEMTALPSNTVQGVSTPTPGSTKSPCTFSSCASPITLATTLGVTSCVTQCNDQPGNSTPGPDFNPPGQSDCYDFTNETVWFQITTPAATATLTVQITGSDLSDPYYAIFATANCTNYTLYDCFTGSGFSANNVSNVPASTTLLIAVSDYTGDVGDFQLCVTPQIDQSACNIASEIVVTNTSMGSPAGGPYLPGEIVSFCYYIDTFDQQGCNWLQGVVPTFGNCWDPTYFQVSGEPINSSGIANQGTFYPNGAWNWWPAGSVTYNNLNNPQIPNGTPIGAGWFFSQDGSVDPDNSWGDGNGMGVMGACEGANSGLSWSVCFDLRATLNCASFIDCSVSFKTFGDGEIGNWTQAGCMVDQPDVLAAGIYCCLLTVEAGPNQTVCLGSSTTLNGSYANQDGATSVQWTSVPAGAVANLSNPNILNPTYTPTGTGSVTFTLTATDQTCSMSDVVTITTVPLPTISGNAPICVGGTVQLTGSPTAAAVTPWVSSNPGVATVGSTGLVTGVSAGTSTITYTNSNGCQATVVVTVNPLPTITGNAPICVGGTVQLTGSPTPAGVNPWVSSNPGVATVSNTGLVTGVAGGSTTITYTNSNGCQASVVVTVNPLPTITGNTPICVNGTVQLTGSPTPAAVNPWVSSNPGVATVSNTGLVTGLSAGSTTITYTNSNGCQASVVVTVNPLPTISGNAPICINGTVQLTGSPTAAAVNPWVSSNPGVATVNGTGLVTGVTAGSTTITYTNSNGCQASVLVTVNPLPTISGNAPICIGATVQLTGSPTAAAVNPWVSSNPAVATVSGTGLVTGVAAGTSTITYTNSNGCQATVVVTVNPNPTISGNAPICIGGTVQLTGSPTAAAVNPWVSSNPGVATVGSTGLVTGVSAGSSTITYTNSNGCQITAVVTVNPAPTISTSQTPLTGCNSNDGVITVTGVGTGTVTWTGPSSGSAPGVTLPYNISPLGPGTYDVTFTSAATGCTSTISQQTLINPGAPVIDPISDFTACGGTYTLQNSNISGTGLTGGQAYYANPGGSGLIANGTVYSAPTTITIYAYDANGACASEESFVVTIYSNPTISGNAPICVGNTVQLTGSGSPNGSTPWSSSNTGVATVSNTGLVTGVAGGSSTITYTDINGCQNTVVVNVNPMPSISGNAPICIGATVQLTGTGTPDPTTPWSSSNPAVATVNSTGLVTGVSAGTSTITYTDNAGCQATAVVTVNANPTISGNAPICIGATVQLTGSATPNAVNPWVSSNPGVATVSGIGLVTGVSAGTSTITYTNANGCQITAVVTVNPDPTISGNSPICAGATVQLTGSATPAAVNPWVSSNPAVATVNSTGLVTGVSVGSTTITYTNSNGCQTTAVVTVNTNPSITGNAPICIGGTVQLSGSGTPNGATPWASSNPAVATINNTGLVTGVSAGTTTITYMTVEGCQNTTVVAVNPDPTISNNAPLCIGTTNQLTGSGTPNASTPWISSNNGVATVSATGMVSAVAAGTTDITYVNSSGCQTTVTVTVNADPVINTSQTPLTGCNTNDGIITVSGAGGATGTVSWSGTAGGSANAVTLPYNITGLAPGTYDVLFTDDATGCTSALSQQIFTNPNAPNLNSISDPEVCDQYTLQNITGSNLSGSQAYWTGSGGTGIQYPAGSVITSSMTLYMYDVNGACSDQDTIVITIIPTPQIDPVSDVTACDQYTLTAITGVNLSGSQAYYNDSQVGGGTVISGTLTTSQQVYIYDQTNGCEDEISFFVTINPSPNVTAITGGAEYCVGDPVANILVDVDGSAPWTVFYTLDGVAMSATGASSPISLGNAAGVYVLTAITDANCSNTASGTQTIVLHNYPSAPQAGQDATYCSTATFDAMSASGSGGTMTWYNDPSLTNSLGTGNTLIPSNVTGVTTYYVTETAFGCEGPASQVMITIEDCAVVIPTAFTPDGDTKNDFWEILNIDAAYENNEVFVYNRWGNLLYTSQKGDYAGNPWDGMYNGEKLPVGSYYFIVNYNDSEGTTETGTVSIILNEK